MSDDELKQLKTRLDGLRSEHRDLDDVIENMIQRDYVNQMQLTRLKKRKLALKDMISKLSSMLIPDMPA